MEQHKGRSGDTSFAIRPRPQWDIEEQTKAQLLLSVYQPHTVHESNRIKKSTVRSNINDDSEQK